MKILRVEKEALKAKGHYSQLIQSNGLLFISGQLPVGLEPSSDIKEQTKNVLLRIIDLLAEAGLDYYSLVKLTIFISDVNDWAMVNEQISIHFPDHKPARSIIPVGVLHYGYKIEVEAIAETA